MPVERLECLSQDAHDRLVPTLGNGTGPHQPSRRCLMLAHRNGGAEKLRSELTAAAT